MARIRTIKPEFWKHEDLSELPEATHMLAGALLNMADDEGFFNAKPALVKAECCPLRESSVSIHDSLAALAKIGYLQFFAGSDGKRYGRVVTFDEHQRVNRPTPSKIKPLCDLTQPSLSPHAQLSEGSPPERKGKEGKGTGNGKEVSPSAPSPAAQPTQPICLTTTKAERLAAVTDDACAAYNATLSVKATPEPGLLPSVHPSVGRENRRKQVGRCLKVARDICQALYGNTVITPEFWREYFGQCAEDPFLSGRQAPGKGHENWQPGFEYLTRPDVMLKVFDKSGAGDDGAEQAA